MRSSPQIWRGALGAGLTLAAITGAPRPVAAGQQQDAPRFRSSVDLTPVDVSVVDGRGRPIKNLSTDAFAVRIDGNPRRVVSAQWVSLVGEGKRSPVVPVPEGYTTNENTTDGRIIVLVVDQPNIRVGGARTILTAAGGFVDRLSPQDRVAVVGLGAEGLATALTSDRDRIKETLARMTGEKPETVTGSSRHNIAPSEALAIAGLDGAMLEQVATRECWEPVSPGRSNAALAAARLACRDQIEMEATLLARSVTANSDATIRSLRELFTGLQLIETPKTVILLSEGFAGTNMMPLIDELSALAAAARATLFVLQLAAQDSGIDTLRRPIARVADAREFRSGLEMLAAAARGTLFTVSGSGANFFERLEAELSGYYLLGVESEPRDRDGKTHWVQVDVPQRGAIVRSRRQIVTLNDTPGRSPREAVAASLSSPLVSSALPLRVATFALQGPERGRVQLLIHADVGTDYTASKSVSVGYFIVDQTGRTVESRAMESRLAPVMDGVPSALEFVSGASLPPGEYTLKLAAAEGDRVGSVEHPIHARLVSAGSLRLSELMVGGPIEASERLQPTVGHTINFGSLHGYVEAYGPQVEAVTVNYEIAVDPRSPALVSAGVPGRIGGDDRMIFTLTMPVNRLPPGRYVLRAMVSAAGKPLTTLTRPFEVAAPGSMTRSAGRGSMRAAGELFLPVDRQAFTRPFRRDAAMTPAVLKPFRDRVSAPAKREFETGVASLMAGDYSKAEASLKRAIRPDVESMAAMVYLAVTFAASGHDTEAAAAWQIALTEGSDLPQIYEWLSQALLRTDRFPEARAILEEAIGKWPSDPRFTGPLAALYATFGQGREAITTLQRYLTARPDDSEAFGLGVEWIYQAHVSGQVVHTDAEDLKLARVYANAYTKVNRAQAELVKLWLSFLDNEKR